MVINHVHYLLSLGQGSPVLAIQKEFRDESKNCVRVRVALVVYPMNALSSSDTSRKTTVSSDGSLGFSSDDLIGLIRTKRVRLSI